MINLNNETDYKLLDSTNKFYIFFSFIILVLFFVIFLKLSLITFEKKIDKPKITNFIKLNPLPTILDSKEKILAYSDYNYSIVSKNENNKFKNYVKRDASIFDIKKTLFQGNPSNQFEKILTRKYPYHKPLHSYNCKYGAPNEGVPSSFHKCFF